MDEIRKLVYEDKASLDAFEINDTGSLNGLIYDEWLLERTEIDSFEVDAKQLYLKVFNDAYYICTLVLLLPAGRDLKPKVLKDKVDMPSVVFPLVHTYLSKLTSSNKGIRRFFADMNKKYKLDNNWKQNFVELQDAISDYQGGEIAPEVFAQRKLTPELLSTVIWWRLTDNFNTQEIKQLVANYARNEHDWQLMVEAIKNAVGQYDDATSYERMVQEILKEVEAQEQAEEGTMDPLKRVAHGVLNTQELAKV